MSPGEAVVGRELALQLTIGRSTYEKLRYAQELLSHGMPSGDLAKVFDRALDALIGQLEKRKFGATATPRPRWRRSSLRQLGFRADEMRRAVEFCKTIPEATLEEQVCATLKFLCPRARVHRPFAASSDVGT